MNGNSSQKAEIKDSINKTNEQQNVHNSNANNLGNMTSVNKAGLFSPEVK